MGGLCPAEGETTAKLTLSADACESGSGKATFMESRIVKTAEPDLAEGYVANETFEYVEQGAYGIFSPEGASDGVPHLSEAHEGYTSDTINGNWSLKLYGHQGQGRHPIRTSPATMRLMPNCDYTMEFETIGSGKVYVVSESDSADKVLEEAFSDGHNTFQFTTGAKTTISCALRAATSWMTSRYTISPIPPRPRYLEISPPRRLRTATG